MRKPLETTAIKKLAVIIFGVMLFLFIGTMVVDYWLEDKIRKVIEQDLPAQTDGIYSVRIGKINVSLWLGSIKIKDIELRSDSTQFAGINRAFNFRSIKVESISANGFSVSRSTPVVGTTSGGRSFRGEP